MAGFDVIVVGAGHAGCEAAAAAARMGARVAVVTLHRRTIAQMPCNPAIGGVGKGHLVKELDALGGLQGWAADRSGVQFRLLNASRGPAVWGPRAQCDKERYGTLMRRIIEGLAGITVIEGEVAGLVVGDGAVTGVRLADGARLGGRRVILTTGTFLGGLLHTGEHRRPGGRFGEAPSVGLGADLRSLGLELRRFKTGTPPRLERDSLDLTRLEEQPGDVDAQPFSWRSQRVENRCVCWVTRTPPRVQQIIRDNLHRSPLYTGRIDGVGPRYCPSIEDKVVRFPHHDEHTVFLERETLGGQSIYVNGLSTSLPEDVQEAVIHAVPGLEGARFLRWGYAVEYDVVPATQVGRDLACHTVDGLLIAGQLLGTSGYEEAASLGLLAGINAALSLRGEEPYVPQRHEGYLGVLVDDICGRDHREPYRMLTSRAEHRLVLGIDSARERLMADGLRLGLVPERAFHVEQARWTRLREVAVALEEATVVPDRGTRDMLAETLGIALAGPTTWAGLLRRHDVDPQRAASLTQALAGLTPNERDVVVGRLRYSGYVERHERQRLRLRRLAALELPEDFDPTAVSGLSREVIDVLQQRRPRTVAEAEGTPGVTAAAIAVLVGHLSAGRRRSVGDGV